MEEVRRGPLGRSQLSMWLDHQWRSAEVRWRNNVFRIWNLPDGVCAEDVEDALTALVERHESLRTVYRADLDLEPRQVVLTPLAVSLQRRSVEEPGDAAVHDIVQRLRRDPFDLSVDRPVRAELVSRGFRPWKLVLVVHHVAADGTAMRVLGEEFATLMTAAARGEHAELPDPGRQPIDHAAHERSAVRTAAARRGLDRIRRVLRALPPRLFPDAREHDGPRYQRVRLVSAAAWRALPEGAARYGGTPGMLLMAAFAALTSTCSGHPLVPVILTSSSRDAADLRRSVGCYFHPILYSCDLAGDPGFGEVVERTSSAYLRALRDGSYGDDEMLELLIRESWRRGAWLSHTVNANFELPAGAGAASAAPDRPTEVVWDRDVGQNLDMEINFAAWHEDGALHCMLGCDTWLMPPERAECFVRGLEWLLCAAVAGEVPCLSEIGRRTGLAPAALPADLVSVGGAWTRLRDTEAQLLAHPGVADAVVTAASGSEVVAKVASGDGSLSPHALRRHVVEMSRRHRAVLTPARFEIFGNDRKEWWRQSPVRAGDGLVPAGRQPVTSAQRALARALHATHPDVVVDMTSPYVLLGGTLRRAPRLIAEVEAQGYEGLTLAAMSSMASLEDLAAGLRHTTGR